MARRPCLGTSEHSCTELSEPCQPRCTGCTSEVEHQRNATRPQYRGTWPAASRAAIAAHRATHGDVCPGWLVDPHPIDPDQWTCDHDVGPLCRPCNGRKGGGHDRARRAGLI